MHDIITNMNQHKLVFEIRLEKFVFPRVSEPWILLKGQLWEAVGQE
jgi:hypothetical protein